MSSSGSWRWCGSSAAQQQKTCRKRRAPSGSCRSSRYQQATVVRPHSNPLLGWGEHPELSAYSPPAPPSTINPCPEGEYSFHVPPPSGVLGRALFLAQAFNLD